MTIQQDPRVLKHAHVSRQRQRRLDFEAEMRDVNSTYGYIGGDGKIHFTIPRRARRNIAWKLAKGKDHV